MKGYDNRSIASFSARSKRATSHVSRAYTLSCAPSMVRTSLLLFNFDRTAIARSSVMSHFDEMDEHSKPASSSRAAMTRSSSESPRRPLKGIMKIAHFCIKKNLSRGNECERARMDRRCFSGWLRRLRMPSICALPRAFGIPQFEAESAVLSRHQRNPFETAWEERERPNFTRKYAIDYRVPALVVRLHITRIARASPSS